MSIAQKILSQAIRNRKYFDSADWVMEGTNYEAADISPKSAARNWEDYSPHTASPLKSEAKDNANTIKLTPNEKIANMVARRRLMLQKKEYFDSADYAVAGKQYLETSRPRVI
eukprot:TRINITY_DN16459_c0_g1_i1.p1 TRINITY_DN16459_c0_g1~~TRINITY_DN16459_c0_g1_i1.p1  ORF type:complete len:123 (-),score=33.90 TRINITY_DN16459_c0_g1_i1:75-413(-)